MYIPRSFAETRVPELHAMMEMHPLAMLVTAGPGGLMASHIPLVLEREGGTMGVLRGHLSRANVQWKELQPGTEVLAVFSGPEHYITPAWYVEKASTGKVVPTWNYAVVHVYGEVSLHEDEAWLRQHLEALTQAHEAPRPEPWKVSDAPEEYVHGQMKGIVGFELTVARLEGKWKVSQNRAEADRQGVAKGLGELGTESSLAMKTLVEER